MVLLSGLMVCRLRFMVHSLFSLNPFSLYRFISWKGFIPRPETYKIRIFKSVEMSGLAV
jgi:hypothetical protein